MFFQILGTALGDWTAHTAGLGYVGGAIVFSSLLMLVAAGYFWTRISGEVQMLSNKKCFRPGGFATLAGVLMAALTAHPSPAQSVSDAKPNATADEIAALKAENERLKGLVPSQSHAMMDVAYHFTNLWFAAERSNWPLAQFYFNETRSHIRWAIRIVPVRRTPAGEVKLEEIFSAFDNSLLGSIQKQIDAKDRNGFKVAYRAALGGCNGCHAASDKAFLHMKVPDQPEARIVDFTPKGQ